jgi:hypothetical protein
MNNNKIIVIGDSQSHFFTHIFKDTKDFIKEYKNITDFGGDQFGTSFHRYFETDILFIWKHGKRGSTLNNKYFIESLDQLIVKEEAPKTAIFVFGTVDVLAHLMPIFDSEEKDNVDHYAKIMAESYSESVKELANRYNLEPFIVLPIIPEKDNTRKLAHEKFNGFLIRSLHSNKIFNIIDIFEVISKNFVAEEFDPYDHHLNRVDLPLALNYILGIVKETLR